MKVYTCYLLVAGSIHQYLHYCDQHDVISGLTPLPANPRVIMNPCPAVCCMFYPHWSISHPLSHLIQRIQTPLRNLVVFDCVWMMKIFEYNFPIRPASNIRLCLSHSCLCLSRPIKPGRTRRWLLLPN